MRTTPLSEPAASAATILVADDNWANLELLSGLLQVEGYEVVSVIDGDQALQTLRSRPIDLLLLDVRMPKRDGFAVCREMKSNPDTRLIPVIIVTASTAGADRIAGKQFTDELESAETVLCSLALSIEAKDPYTEGHCARLSKYSVALAERLALPAELQVALRRAGVVHDIGKVAVPEHILLKGGPLSPKEWIVMKEHPVIGERICAPLKSFRLVLPIIRHHHEKLDGSGYPDGLKGNAIPLTARVLQTVDIYDALATERPYRKALSPKEAFELMREEVERGWWDGSLVDKLEALMNESAPPVSWVEAKNER